MSVPPVPPGPDGARFDRAIDSLEFHNQRLERLRAIFPSFKKIFLIVCLAGLSWFATYVGMLELIAANTGEVSLAHKIAIGFAVATLMLMILYILDALFSPISWWLRVLYIFGYVLLTLISVGFGFGFYWKVLESRGEATRSAEAAIGQVQRALEESKTRIAQLGATLDTLTVVSREKESEERVRGGTCPDSPPGSGPRMRLRESDAKSFGFTSDFIKSRAGGIQTDLDSLNGDLAKVLSRDPSTFDALTGTRNAFMQGLNRKLDLTLTRFNALRTDPQLTEQKNALSDRAAKTSFDDGKGGSFLCPDPQLQTALNGVVRAIDSLPSIEKPNIAAVEGSEAIVEAFRRLTATTVGALTLELPPSPEKLRELQRQAMQQAARPQEVQSLMAREAGLSPRDYIPLFVAIFVDFCLLLVSINRPINRFQMLAHSVREARDGPVGEILARFHETHLTGLRKEFEIFQHAVFDFLGDYYVAVPVNAERTEARYLANLFVGLEGKGIVDRVLLPPAFVVRRKLKLQGSTFAQEQAYRLYRFRNGAWSKLVLDAILGTGPLPAEKREVVAAKPASELQARTNGPAAAEHAKPNGHGPSTNGANSKHDRDQRFANGRLEAGGYSEADDDEHRRPSLPTPEAKATNGHKPAE
ncbi:MAG: hypothetical protein ACXWVI_05140 [Methyloceanibacter sp.]